MRKISLLLCFLFLVSCSSVTYIASDKSKVYPPIKKKDEIKVLRDREGIKNSVEIGSIYIHGMNFEDAVETMKDEAAKVGGEAIFDIQATNAAISATVLKVQ